VRDEDRWCGNVIDPFEERYRRQEQHSWTRGLVSKLLFDAIRCDWYRLA
jgi:hypothetical protein